MLKIAKGLEPQSQTNQNQKDEKKKSEKDFEMSEEWPFSGPFNFDTWSIYFGLQCYEIFSVDLFMWLSCLNLFIWVEYTFKFQ